MVANDNCYRNISYSTILTCVEVPVLLEFYSDRSDTACIAAHKLRCPDRFINFDSILNEIMGSVLIM